MRFVRAAALLEDTPRRIALGSAIGLFFSAQPFVGSQMAAAALTARLSRASVLASLPWTWLTNPLTVTPFYYGSYCVGLTFWPETKNVDYDRISGMTAQVEEMGFFRFLEGGWREVLRLLADIAIPLQIGSLLIGAVAGLLGYVILHRLVIAIQARRIARRQRWLATIKPVATDAAPLPLTTEPPSSTHTRDTAPHRGKPIPLPDESPP